MNKLTVIVTDNSQFDFVQQRAKEETLEFYNVDSIETKDGFFVVNQADGVKQGIREFLVQKYHLTNKQA